MSTSSQPERRTSTRRSVLRAGLGVALGTGLLYGTSAAAATSGPRIPAKRLAPMQQQGTSLCDQPGDSASVWGLGSGDLAIPYYREHDGDWGYVFGDSYRQIQQGNSIGSPVMMTQTSFDSSGATPITFTGTQPASGPAGQLFNYRHFTDNGFGYEISRIPNDCIEFGGRTYIQYTSVNNWTPPAGHDGSLMAGVAYSDDFGATWTDYPYHWAGDAQGANQSLYMMWSFAGIDPHDGWLYIYSKRWNGSHLNTGDGGAIQLFRVQPNDFRNGDFGAQQNWAFVNGSWGWTTSAAPSVMLAGNNIGEFSVKIIGGTYCMSYFDTDAVAITTRTAPAAAAVWTAPSRQWFITNPNPYGGYIHPGSASATSLTLIVSQWDGTLGSPPYWALQYDGITP